MRRIREAVMSHAALQSPPATGRDFSLYLVQQLVWMRVRRLFPPQATACRTAGDALAITWPLESGRDRQATTVVLRFEDDFVRAVSQCSAPRRHVMAAEADAMVRAGMIGYDPEARLPQQRVIVVG
jgi:hypothetical protein